MATLDQQTVLDQYEQGVAELEALPGAGLDWSTRACGDWTAGETARAYARRTAESWDLTHTSSLPHAPTNGAAR
ncbi:MAG: hypothetical protein ACKVHU_12065 [Acidimicrobiales bacterium]|jgi:hypothetical protein